jgi:hypothetical protein
MGDNTFMPVVPRLGGKGKSNHALNTNLNTEKLLDKTNSSDVFAIKSEETMEETITPKKKFWTNDKIMIVGIVVIIIIIITVIIAIYFNFNKPQSNISKSEIKPSISSANSNAVKTCSLPIASINSKIPTKADLVNTLSKIKINTVDRIIKPKVPVVKTSFKKLDPILENPVKKSVSFESKDADVNVNKDDDDDDDDDEEEDAKKVNDDDDDDKNEYINNTKKKNDDNLKDNDDDDLLTNKFISNLEKNIVNDDKLVDEDGKKL